MIGKLVSGGQTGVDRAALDIAFDLDIPCGGWCPRGRKAEDGSIPAHYPLVETPSDDYSQRTKWNIRDSDGTLILTWGEPSGGTLLTIDECCVTGKPHLVIDLSDDENCTDAVEVTREWIAAKVLGGTLNVAGPRAREHPGLYEYARGFLRAVLGDGAAD
jgi:hypothetical protein